MRPRVTDDTEAVYDEDLRLRARKAPPEEPDSRTHRLPLGDGDGEAVEARLERAKSLDALSRVAVEEMELHR